MWVQALDVAGKSEQEEWETDEHCCSDIKSALCTILMFEKKKPYQPGMSTCFGVGFFACCVH